MNNQKLYVVTRSDLSKSQQAVQAGHALAEFCMYGVKEVYYGMQGNNHVYGQNWSNGTLVYLKVKDEEELKTLHDKVGNCFAFHEPDMDNQLTAFARLGNHPEFEKLPLV